MSSLVGYLNFSSVNALYVVLKYSAGAGIIGSTLIAAGLYLFQCRLIYPSYMPDGSRKYVPSPGEVGLPFEDVEITTSDNVKIKGFVIPARRSHIPTAALQHMSQKERKEASEKELAKWPEERQTLDAVEFIHSRPTVVIFHANAGNMGHRVPIGRKFNVDYKCNIFMLSYRGYGLSQGVASEAGIIKDVDAAMEFVSKHPLLGPTKTIVYGQSIGGAVCLYAASKFPKMVSGVIIENTFFSLSKLIPCVLPQLPKFLLPLLLTENWDASKTLPHIPPYTPVLMMSGKRDMLVPPAQMQQLKALREENNGKVRFREFDGEHNDTFLAAGYWEEVGKWIREEIEL